MFSELSRERTAVYRATTSQTPANKHFTLTEFVHLSKSQWESDRLC